MASCCRLFFLLVEDLQLRSGISHGSWPKWFVPGAGFDALVAEFVGDAVEKDAEDLIAFLISFQGPVCKPESLLCSFFSTCGLSCNCTPTALMNE